MVPQPFRFGLTLLLCGASTLAGADLELKPETLKSWSEYIQTVEARLRNSGNDEVFVAKSTPVIRTGQILVAPSPDNLKHVPDGLIHDWTAVAFMPNCKIEDILAVVSNYDHYQDIYRPAILEARKTGQAGNEDLYEMVMRSRSVLSTTALQSDYKAFYVQVSPTRAYRVSQVTRIQEIENYHRPGERRLQPDQGHGYIWRVYTVSKMEEGAGGVYVEFESIVLSRDIPAGLRWVAAPMIRRMAREAMTASLEKTRAAIHPNAEGPARGVEALTVHAGIPAHSFR